MITIDKGMAHSSINSSTRTSGLYQVGVTGKIYEEHTIRNCYGVYLENVHNCLFPLLDLRNVYSLNMRGCDGNTFKKVLIDDSWVGVKLNFLCSSNRFEQVISSNIKDLDPNLTSPNGDGIIIDKSDCTDNWFGTVKCTDAADSGLDQQGTRTVIESYEASGNKHASKLWGSTTINKYVSYNHTGNSILCISGEHTIKNAHLKESLQANIKMGLGGYRQLAKKLTIDGYWDKATLDNPDTNSTLIKNLTIGEPPIGDYKTMYDELLVKYDALRIDLANAVSSANTQEAKISALETELASVKAKLDQIKAIIG